MASKQSHLSHKQLLTLENAGPIQMGFWVPNRLWATAKYLIPLRKEIEYKRKSNTLKPFVIEVINFKEWVSSNSIFKMWFNLMIDQANDFISNIDEETRREIEKDGDVIWIVSFDNFFEIVNEIITTSPAFNNTAQVGTPLNGLLAVSMATPAGIALFHNQEFNNEFKKVLNSWNSYLKSPASLDKLDITNPNKLGSWISHEAHQAGVWDQIVHDPTKPGYGFNSWNAFFIRNFVPGARPFHGSGDVVNIGCETTPWQYANNLIYSNNFWIKDVNYSLIDLFGNNEKYAHHFIGGQLYQGFLSATHYHRWNSPIDGRIIRSWLQPGTYFAIRPNQGETPGTFEGTEAQPYLGHVATRAIFIFEHHLCGYIALLCIGMVEVSTCYIKSQYLVNEGDDPVSVQRGDEIGRFEFGGSTHIMIFQKDKVLLEQWAIDAIHHQTDQKPTPMGTIIAKPIRKHK
mmetsp:Transcript_7309/g.6555  ORF Transcript_7309/g.6555 Transcript_7309/m.6555 type:complete len:458 (-) Transcript_7309:46-1419(-)